MLSPNGISLATGSTSAAATFPVRASSRRHRPATIATGCSHGTSAKGISATCDWTGSTSWRSASLKAISGPAKPKPPWASTWTNGRMTEQREALQAIFGGQAGGWPAGFAANIGDLRGIEFVPIAFEVAGDLAYWRVEIPGRSSGMRKRWAVRPRRPANACRPSTRRVLRSAGRQVATWGRSVEVRSEGFGLDWTGTAARASTFRSTGPVPTRTARLSNIGPRDTLPSWLRRFGRLGALPFGLWPRSPR